MTRPAVDDLLGHGLLWGFNVTLEVQESIDLGIKGDFAGDVESGWSVRIEQWKGGTITVPLDGIDAFAASLARKAWVIAAGAHPPTRPPT